MTREACPIPFIVVESYPCDGMRQGRGGGQVVSLQPTDKEAVAGVAFVVHLSSRWREMRAYNDNACGESKSQNSYDSLLDLTFLSLLLTLRHQFTDT